MYLWMQANRKKMLAVFGVLLMIVFVLPSTPGMFQQHDSPMGRIGDDEVTRMQVGRAHQEWEFIVSRIAPQAPFLFGGNDLWPLALFSDKTVTAINQDPALFYLLQHEARQMNVQISQEQIDQHLGIINTLLAPAANMDEALARRQAVENLLLVGKAFDRAASVVKVSEPRVRQEIAEQSQIIRTKLVEFAAADFMTDVPNPTPEQIEAQIEAYGAVDPQAIDQEANPFGFSYRLPDRVKLQYIQIPRQQVREQVEKSLSEFEWRSQAYAHYERNKARYEITEPESSITENVDLTLGPTTAPATAPATSEKRIRPFDEVYESIKSELLQPRVDQKMKQVQDRASSLLQKGFEQYEAKQAGRPVTGATAINGDYTSFEYLQQVAGQIEREYGVTPTVQAIANRWLSESELMGLAELGSAMLPGRTPRESVPFANYVLERAEPLRTEAERETADTLSLWEPSAALTTASQDVAFVRLIEVQAAHPPKTPEERQEVATAAAEDLKTAAAYAKALEAARALHEQVAAGQPLAEAAGDRRVIEAGPISRMYRSFGAGTQIQGYFVSDASRETFGDAVFNLLREATADSRHPKSLIEVPRDAKVVVAELDSIDRLPIGDPTEMAVSATNQARISGLFDLAMDWFNPDRIRQRTGWQPI